MTGRQEVFQQAMNQGHSAAWDQLWDRAAEFYRQALEEVPNHPQALANLGLALYELQSYEEALHVYIQAARQMPNDPLPVEKVAQLYERMGNLERSCQASLAAAELYLKNRDADKAIENWLRVTRLNPENLPAHSRLAQVYERLGEKGKAISEYLAVASLLQANGDLPRAVRSVNQALQVQPNNNEAVEALALLREYKPLPRPSRPRGGTAPLRMSQVRQLSASTTPEQGEQRNDPVAQACQKALTVLAGMLFEPQEEGTEEAGARRGLQTIVRGTGQLPDSRLKDRTRIILHLSQVVDLQTKGEFAQAGEELERAIEAGLDHPAAYFDLAYLQEQLGRLDNAQRNLQLSVKKPDFALASRLLSAEIYNRQACYAEAGVEYLEALKIADAQIVPEEEADDLRQLYESIIESFRRESDPAVVRAVGANISDLLARPDWKENLQRARQELPARPAGSPPVPLAELVTQARSGQVIESIAHIHRLAEGGNLRTAMEEIFYTLQAAPTYLPLHAYMAELLMQNGREAEAALKLTVVARAYTARGEPRRAVEIYRRILALAPTDLNTRSHLIEQLIALGELNEAIEEYMELAELYYSMADLEMVRKTYTEALRLTQQTARVDRGWRVRILHRMADINLQSLDWRQALRIFEQIRTLQPDDEQARANLIELNFRLGQEQLALAELDNYISFLSGAGQRSKAILFVENLLNEAPRRLMVRRRLADLYRQNGRIAEAIQQLDALGEALLEAGDKVGAIQAIEAILAMNPPNKADYQRLLAQIKSQI